MEDCIFCKIISGEIPSAKVYEDEQVVAFLDITQTTPGHTLLVPKEHIKDIFEYTSTQAAEILSRLPIIAKGIEKAFPDVKGINILNNNREIAYQTVFHSHWHLIPRYAKEDGFAVKFTNNMDKFDLQEIASKIQEGIQVD